MKARTISIIGLGRTGTSVGLALKASTLDVTVVGHDKNRDAMKAAKEAGAVDTTTWRLVSAASEAHILVLCVPTPAVKSTLEAIGQDLDEQALVLDFSSPKEPAQRWAEAHLERGHYVGAVPVLAAEALSDGTSGVAGARADLFQNSIFCFMPAPSADPQAVETAVNLGAVLGAKPFFLDAGEYDSLVLGVETVPGLLAAALFQAVTEAAGWRDILRFANLPFAQATMPLRDGTGIAQRALNDQEATLRWLDSVLEALSDVRQWVREGDDQRLGAFIEQLDGKREQWLFERTENQWREEPKSDFEPLGFMEHFIGRRGSPDA